MDLNLEQLINNEEVITGTEEEVKQPSFRFTSDQELDVLLTKVYWLAVEEATRRLSGIVVGVVLFNIRLHNAAYEFFKNNSDLHPDDLSKEANRIFSENPDWSYDKIFSEAVKVVRGKTNGVER